jgi:hypothetical protein
MAPSGVFSYLLLGSLGKVDVWLDLRMPFVEAAIAKFWQVALTKHVPGTFSMTTYVTRVGTVIQFVAFSIVSPLMYAVIFKMCR